MRCAIYNRISTTDQTIENKNQILKEYSKNRGYGFLIEYFDQGISLKFAKLNCLGDKHSNPETPILNKGLLFYYNCLKIISQM